MQCYCANKDSRLTSNLGDIGLQKDGCWLQDDPHSHSTKIDGFSKYKLGYIKRGSSAFKKDGCGVPSAARALRSEGLLMR